MSYVSPNIDFLLMHMIADTIDRLSMANVKRDIRTSLLIILMVCSAHPMCAQLNTIYTRQMTSILDIEVAGSAMFAAGDRCVRMSHDSGRTWQIVVKAHAVTFIKVSFVDQYIGYAVGYHRDEPIDRAGTVYHTYDGGFSWQESKQSFPRPTAFAAYGDDAWMACWNGAMYNTTDVGYTWQSTVLPYSEHVRCLYFESVTHGWATGPRGLLLRTTDGGKSWREIELERSIQINDIQITSNGMGLAVGDSGVVLRTVNAGLNWKESKTHLDAVNPTFTRVQVDGRYAAMLIDGYFVALSNDSGISFRSFEVRTCENSREYYHDIKISGSILDVAGGGGFYGRYDIAGVPRLIQAEAMQSLEGGRDIASQACNRFAVVGGSPYSLVVTQDGGRTWCGTGLEGERYCAICYSTTGTLWLAGQMSGRGILAYTSDGGLTLNRYLSETLPMLNDIVFANADTGWVAADSGVIYRSVTSGRTWRKRQTPVDDEILKLAFQDVANGYAVSPTALLETTDGGDTWMLAAGPVTDSYEYYKHVAFVGRDTWIIASNFRVYIKRPGKVAWDTLYVFGREESVDGLAVDSSGNCGVLSIRQGILVSADGFRTVRRLRELDADKTETQYVRVAYDGCGSFLVVCTEGYLMRINCGTTSVDYRNIEAGGMYDDIDAGSENAASIVEYDLLGRRVAADYRGLVLKVICQNGRVKTLKVWR